MPILKKTFIIMFLAICICFIVLGIYEIINSGFKTGMKLLGQFNPIVIGCTSFFLVYKKYFSKKAVE